MKKLIYKIEGYTFVYNPETKKEEQRSCVSTVTVECPTQAVLDANYPMAEKEAIPGSIEVTGEFDPEQDNASTDDVLNALLGVTV